MQDDLNVNIAFIEEVQKHPQLYDRSVGDYQIHNVSEKIWKEIADKFDDTVESCKCKWKSIRSSYIRHLKKKGKKDYYLARYLTFLTPFTKFRDKISAQSSQDDSLINIQQKNNDSDYENDLTDRDVSDSEMKTNLKRQLTDDFRNDSESLQKRKFVPIEDTKERYMEFLTSLYPCIKAFSEKEFNRFQTGVFELIIKINDKTA